MECGLAAVLMLLVLRQMRGRRLRIVGLLWPLAIVGWAGAEYLGGVPNSAPDVVLVVLLAGVGVALGVGCGVLTEVRGTGDGQVLARATGPAAALWITGVAGRLVFGLVLAHGGAIVVDGWDARLGVQGLGSWATALTLMALCEVATRSIVLFVRYLRSRARTAAPDHAAEAT